MNNNDVKKFRLIAAGALFLLCCCDSSTDPVNQSPSLPFDPTPSSGATDVSYSISLSWYCIDADEDVLTYDLYFGNDSDPLLVESDIQSNSINVINLKSSSTYYWKIKARDSHGKVSEGPRWSFQTMDHSGITNEREFDLGDSDISISMVWIEPGTFRMGAQSGESGANGDEYPRHLVTIPQGFWIGKYEITQAQWEAVVGSWQFHFNGNPNRPAEMVSWNQIHNPFLSEINNPEIGEPWRLPSEAEWEYACRGGISGTRFWWGDDNTYQQLDNYAWYWGNNDTGNGHETHDMGLKEANPFGIYDMNGNVWEWCEDYYQFTYNQVPTDGSATIGTGGNGRVARGGGWGSYGAVFCRSAARARNNPQFGYDIFGFRLVRNGG